MVVHFYALYIGACADLWISRACDRAILSLFKSVQLSTQVS